MGPSKLINRSRFSLLFIITFALGFAVLSGNRIYNDGYENIEVTKARGGDTLFIDGNKDFYGVSFDHKAHEGLVANCANCHHMNKPGDKATGCLRVPQQYVCSRRCF